MSTKPQIGEVWMTKFGRYAIIVATPEEMGDDKVGMLWFDRIEGLTVSKIYDRLESKIDTPMSDVFKFWQTRHKEMLV